MDAYHAKLQYSEQSSFKYVNYFATKQWKLTMHHLVLVVPCSNMLVWCCVCISPAVKMASMELLGNGGGEEGDTHSPPVGSHEAILTAVDKLEDKSQRVSPPYLLWKWLGFPPFFLDVSPYINLQLDQNFPALICTFLDSLWYHHVLLSLLFCLPSDVFLCMLAQIMYLSFEQCLCWAKCMK